MRGGSQSMVNLQDKFKELFKELTGGEINKKNLPVNQKNLPGILMEINEDDYATIKPIVLQMYGKVRWVEKAFKDAERKKKERGKERKKAAEAERAKQEEIGNFLNIEGDLYNVIMNSNENELDNALEFLNQPVVEGETLADKKLKLIRYYANHSPPAKAGEGGTAEKPDKDRVEW